ncbi:MAG: hypothetical protein AB3N28_00830, partial [Kordiimonas sp.]
MDQKFPVLPVAKAALLMPLGNGLKVLKAFGLILASVVVGAIVMMAILLVSGVDGGAFESLPAAVTSGDFSGMQGLGGFFIGYLLLIVIIFGMIAHVFNYWVRLAAFGADGAKFPTFKAAVSAASVNMVKFLLIGILTIIISLVVTFVLNQLGLSPSFSEQMAAAETADIAEQTTSASLSTLIMAVITCLVYSAFSANLTQTAIGSDHEGLEHPHNIDFAIVLLLIYAVALVPTLFAAYAGLSGVVMTIQIILGFYI